MSLSLGGSQFHDQFSSLVEAIREQDWEHAKLLAQDIEQAVTDLLAPGSASQRGATAIAPDDRQDWFRIGYRGWENSQNSYGFSQHKDGSAYVQGGDWGLRTDTGGILLSPDLGSGVTAHKGLVIYENDTAETEARIYLQHIDLGQTATDGFTISLIDNGNVYIIAREDADMFFRTNDVDRFQITNGEGRLEAHDGVRANVHSDLGKGIVAWAEEESTATGPTSGTTELAVTGSQTGQVVMESGNWYRADFTISGTASQADDSFVFSLRYSTDNFVASDVLIGRLGRMAFPTTHLHSFHGFLYFLAPTTSTITLRATVARTNGTGTYTSTVNSSIPTQLAVADVGPGPASL